MRGIDMKCNVRSVGRRPRGPHAGSVGAGAHRNHTPHFITGGWMTGQSGSPPPSPVTLDSPRGTARLGGLRARTHPGPARGATSRRATRDWRRAVAAPAERRVYPMARAGRGGAGCLGGTRAPDLNEEGRHRAWSSSPPGARTGDPGPAPAGHGPALAGLCPEHRARPPVLLLAPALVLRPNPACSPLRSAGPRDPRAAIVPSRRSDLDVAPARSRCACRDHRMPGHSSLPTRTPWRRLAQSPPPKNARRRRAVHP